MRAKSLGVGVLAAGLLALPTVQAEPISKGQVMANSCLTCHGSEGQGPGKMPSIRDFTEQGLVNKLSSFKAGEAEDTTVMDRHAAGYSDAEIRAIAKHIADLN